MGVKKYILSDEDEPISQVSRALEQELQDIEVNVQKPIGNFPTVHLAYVFLLSN